MSSVHIYIHRGRTRDAGTGHDPKNGQFAGGKGGATGGAKKPGLLARAKAGIKQNWKQAKITAGMGAANRAEQRAERGLDAEAHDPKNGQFSSGGGSGSGGAQPGNRHGYNPKSVNEAIASSNRAGRHIGGREAKMIHALLKGRQPISSRQVK